MVDVVVGLLVILIGGLLCFRGWMLLRTLIPIWGAFAGFFLGAGLVASVTGGGFLATVVGWMVGLGVALVFGLLAYLYYEVSVVLAMAAIGFALATSVLVALGVTWSWAIVIVGVVAAILLAFVAIVGDLPTIILVFLSATAGASTMVGGAMLVLGVVDLADFTSGATTQRLTEDWWWYLVYGVLVIAGIVAQWRGVDRVTETMREAWRQAGGREMRPASTAVENPT